MFPKMGQLQFVWVFTVGYLVLSNVRPANTGSGQFSEAGCASSSGTEKEEFPCSGCRSLSTAAAPRLQDVSMHSAGVVTVPLGNSLCCLLRHQTLPEPSLALHHWRRLTATSAGGPWAYHDIQRHHIIRPLCFLETLNCTSRPSSK